MDNTDARVSTPNPSGLTDMSLLLQSRFRTDMASRLRACLNHHRSGPNPAYSDLLVESGIGAGDLPESTEELNRLPLTDKDFLKQGHFPEHPNGPIYKVVSTSGSTQTAVAIPHNFAMSQATLFDNFLRLMALNRIQDFGRFYGIGHWVPGETASGSFITFDFIIADAMFDTRHRKTKLKLHGDDGTRGCNVAAMFYCLNLKPDRNTVIANITFLELRK